ncbi:Uncharacterised protein [Vibrio cholerae]|nr:Uncharacterised protein [Vibrio cholerae]CSI50797.1 Uncharacterised protein [Vibrio cholerae]
MSTELHGISLLNWLKNCLTVSPRNVVFGLLFQW